MLTPCTFCPKIEIINHFDNLINKIDIDTDICIENYNEEQTLSELLKSSETIRRDFRNTHEQLNIKFRDEFNTSRHESLDLWPESTKVIDYLNQVRMKTIEQLRKAQEDTLEYYSLNSSRIKSQLYNVRDIYNFRRILFDEKFYFQVHLKQSKKRFWAFNVFTFATDFYMSSYEIDSLQ